MQHMLSLTSTFPKYLLPSGGPVVLTPWLLRLAGCVRALPVTVRCELVGGRVSGAGRSGIFFGSLHKTYISVISEI